MKLRTFIARRLLLLIPVLIGLTMITFTISHIIPADPAQAWAGGDKADQAQVEAIEEEYHLNEPLHVQYYYYMRDLLRYGEMGRSPVSGRDVSEDIKEYFPATFELTLFAMFFVIIIGIPTGIFSAIKRNKVPDHLIRVVSLMGSSMPIFWLGLLLQLVFAQWPALHWGQPILPPSGRIGTFIDPPTHLTGLFTVDSLLTLNAPAFTSSVAHIILPAFTLCFAVLGTIMRVMRSSMLDVMNQEYMKTARAKGLKEKDVIYKHGVKNALIPTTTILGMAFGGLLGGAVLTESIFGWPGMGRYAITSILFLDFPAIMGFTLLMGFVFVLMNLLVDILYAYLDPRIRLG